MGTPDDLRASAAFAEEVKCRLPRRLCGKRPADLKFPHAIFLERCFFLPDGGERRKD